MIFIKIFVLSKISRAHYGDTIWEKCRQKLVHEGKQRYWSTSIPQTPYYRFAVLHSYSIKLSLSDIRFTNSFIYAILITAFRLRSSVDSIIELNWSCLSHNWQWVALISDTLLGNSLKSGVWRWSEKEMDWWRRSRDMQIFTLIGRKGSVNILSTYVASKICNDARISRWSFLFRHLTM